ncbi:MAG: 1-deoxy-D-xylulose-5-phosphate reductoisomerase [Gemmatimonadota bacterium]
MSDNGGAPLRIAVLGSTGSIGRSTLEVVDRHPGRFRVVALSANRSVDALAEQVARFEPDTAVLAGTGALDGVDDLPDARWTTGRDAVLEVCERDDVDVVVNALVGAAGLEPTLRSLRAGKRVALANKESLVAGGNLVHEAARAGRGELIPVDSEHSAILQCVRGCGENEVERIVLTASGGPFRGWSRSALESVTPEDALDHPTWSMGAKITVDSATLANKALEVVEAHFLYDLGYDDIDVVVHPQSIIHSFVEFVDGSVLAQMGFPTMELPILYALTHPTRVSDGALRTFDPVASSPLTFEPVDDGAFPLFGLGVAAGRTGGTATAVFNAANEVAVDAFLNGRIGILEMADVVSGTLTDVECRALEDIDDVLEADREAREFAGGLVRSFGARAGR